MTEFLKNLHIRRIRAEDAADISGIQTAAANSRESIDFQQIIEPQVLKNEDANFVAERNGQVVGYPFSGFAGSADDHIASLV